MYEYSLNIFIMAFVYSISELEKRKSWVKREKFESLNLHELPKESSDDNNFPLRRQLSGLDSLTVVDSATVIYTWAIRV